MTSKTMSIGPVQRYMVMLVLAAACGGGGRSGSADAAATLEDARLGDAATSDAALDGGNACWQVTLVCDVGTDNPLVTGLVGAIDLVEDGNDLFWAANGSLGESTSVPGTVGRVDLLTGTACVLADNEAFPRGIIADADYVYWSGGGTADQAGGVFRVPRAGGVRTAVAEGRPPPGAVALDDTFIYWTERDAQSGVYQIVRVPKTGGDITQVAGDFNSPDWIAVDGATMFVSNFTGPPAIARVPASGGTPTTLASPTYPAAGMVPLGDQVYFLSFDGRLWHVPKSGATSAKALTPAPSPTTDGMELVIDGEEAYWSNIYSPVARVPLAGGDVEYLAGTDHSVGLALSPGCVYWTTGAFAGDTVIHSTGR